MARVGALDFSGFVEHRQHLPGTRETGGAYAYAYVSDKQTRSAFDRVKPVQYAVNAAVRLFKAFGKRDLCGHAVRVGPKQFPKIHALTKHCADTLGIETPALYIANNPFVNAMTLGTPDDSFIIVHSALIDHMSEDELLSVIGHECGHVHNEHVVYLTAFFYLTRIAATWGEVFVRSAMLALSAWRRRAEITCDRAGLLCVKDLEVSNRALAKLALGSQKLYEEFNVEAFLEQYEEAKDGVGKYAELTASHPWLPKRLIALKTFADSDLYKKHIGLSEPGLTMEQVDEKVHEIIKVLG